MKAADLFVALVILMFAFICTVLWVFHVQDRLSALEAKVIKIEKKL